MTSGQYPLELALPEAMGRGDFFVAPSNAAALAAVEDWARWPGGKLVLLGPPGSGKTHLARIWAAEAGAAVVPAAALAPEALPALAAAGRVAVEDAEAVAGEPAREAALLHLHNLIAEGGGRLLLTARAPAAAWGLRLPDLASRMESAAHARLGEPDDRLLSAVLVKLFADRQIAVTPALIPYLCRRIERSLAAARAAVAALDAAALAQGRPVTLALARELLDSPAAGAP